MLSSVTCDIPMCLYRTLTMDDPLIHMMPLFSLIHQSEDGLQSPSLWADFLPNSKSNIHARPEAQTAFQQPPNPTISREPSGSFCLSEACFHLASEMEFWGRNGSRAGRAFALNLANPCLIPTSGSPSLPGVIPECRSRSSP